MIRRKHTPAAACCADSAQDTCALDTDAQVACLPGKRVLQAPAADNQSLDPPGNIADMVCLLGPVLCGLITHPFAGTLAPGTSQPQ